MATTNPNALEVTYKGKAWHTGYSRLQKYLACPKQYRYAYVDKLQSTQKSVPLLRGSAYHGALESALTFKMKKGRNLSLGKTLELAQWYCEQAHGLNDLAKKDVLNAVELWYATYYDSLNPLFVEQRFSIVRNGVTYTGMIDHGDADGSVVDHKLSFELWDKDRAKNSVQAVIYQWAWEDIFAKQFGVEYKRFKYQVLKTFPGVSCQQLVLRKLNDKDSKWYEDHLRELAEAMVAGVFYARPSVSTCKNCDFRKSCEPVFPAVSITKGGDLDPDWD